MGRLQPLPLHSLKQWWRFLLLMNAMDGAHIGAHKANRGEQSQRLMPIAKNILLNNVSYHQILNMVFIHLKG
jgi:hypothetical protein